MTGRKGRDKHFAPSVWVLKYWSNFDCIFIATFRQNCFEISCAVWVYSHIPASERFQGSHMTPSGSHSPQPPSVWGSLRPWKFRRSLPRVHRFPGLTTPRRAKTSQGQDSESAWEERMSSLVGTLWGFVCFMWQILLLSFCKGGTKLN